MQNLLAIIDLAPQTFDNFIVGTNQEVVDKIQKICKDQNLLDEFGNPKHINKYDLSKNLYIWGESGCGTTHLLKAFYHNSNQKKVKFIEFDQLTNQKLENIVQHTLLIDSLKFSNNERLIKPLFHILRMADRGEIYIIIAGDNPTSQMAFPEEITTRISKMQPYKINRLTDSEKIEAMLNHAKRRSMTINEKITYYFLQMFPRDLRILTSLIDNLDDWSLKNKTPPTLASAKKMLRTKYIDSNNL